jgi:hypothetical protein
MLGQVRWLCNLQLQLVVYLGGWVLSPMNQGASTMVGSSWIEMPALAGAAVGEPARPKHPIQGTAVLVYRGERVYVALEEPDMLRRIARLPDVRCLAPDEAAEFEATLPRQLALVTQERARSHHAARLNRRGRVGLGDVVQWLTGALRIQECGACGQRKKKLNAFTIPLRRKW